MATTRPTLCNLDALAGRAAPPTWDMAFFRQVTASFDHQHHLATPCQRLNELLRRYGQYLGTTQLRHLTGHSVKVSRLAQRLGQLLRMSATDLRRLRVAGLLHDLGKLLTPEELLAKPGRLSARERRLMDRHAADGAEMALLLGVDRRTAEFIQHHHTWFAASRERAGGHGRGVPLGARVLTVADAFVTMLGERPYQAARPPEEALAELRRFRATQFDPRVVDAADQMIHRHRAFSPDTTTRHPPEN